MQNSCLFAFKKYRSSHRRCSIKKLLKISKFAEKHLCWSLFLIQNIAKSKSLRVPTFKKICERLLLKMCSWNCEKIKLLIRNFLLYIKETSENVCFYFMKEKSQKACFYFMIGFFWDWYSDTVFLWCGELELIKRSSRK